MMQILHRMNGRTRKLRISVLTVGAVVLLGSGAADAMTGRPASARDGGGPAAGDQAPSASPTDIPVRPSVTPTPEPTTPTPIVEPPLGTVPLITSRAPIAMPLDSFMTPMNDIKLIDTARTIAATNCMHSLGFADWTNDSVVDSVPSDYQESDILDYLDPTEVAKTGYPTTRVDKSSEVGAITAKSSAPAPTSEELAAYFGSGPKTVNSLDVPSGGCSATGAQAVTGSSDQLPADPREIQDEARFASLDDSRMKKAFGAWSACMAQHGLTYDDPLSSQNDPRWGDRTAATPAGDGEKQVAAVDADCQKDINLVGIYKALQIAYQKQLITAVGSKLADSLSQFNGWVSHAKAVLATPQAGQRSSTRR